MSRLVDETVINEWPPRESITMLMAMQNENVFKDKNLLSLATATIMLHVINIRKDIASKNYFRSKYQYYDFEKTIVRSLKLYSKCIF